MNHNFDFYMRGFSTRYTYKPATAAICVGDEHVMNMLPAELQGMISEGTVVIAYDKEEKK